MSSVWLYPPILIAGELQAWGPPMNGSLRQALTIPLLASVVSFVPVVAFQVVSFACVPRPLPTVAGVAGMRWRALLGGSIGSFAVVTGLSFVDKVGAGACTGLTITANILTSLAVDQFGALGMPPHAMNSWRMLGGALMVAWIALTARF